MPNLKLYPKILMRWEITGEDLVKKDKKWFIYFTIFEVFLISYGILSKNYLFLIILILIGIIYYIQLIYPPREVYFEIRKDGVKLGDKLYLYKDIKSFSLLYRPKEGIKKLFIEFKSKFTPVLEIPIKNQNPVKIRDLLSKYIIEKKIKEEPIDHFLKRTLKL